MKPRSKWRRSARRLSRPRVLLYSLLAVFFLLAGIEILCRVGLSAYIHLRYVPIWNSDSEAALRHHKTLGWVPESEQRFRGKSEVTKTKTPDVFRIITMGDSCTRGAGVEADQTFSWLLEDLLRDAGPPQTPEVLNAGVNGYHLVQMGDYLETYLLQFDPDLVIVYANAFDSSDRAIDPGRSLESFDVRQTGTEPSNLEMIDAFQELFFSLKSYYLLRRLILPLRDSAPDIKTDTEALLGKHSAELLRIRLLCEMVGADFMIAEYVTRRRVDGEDRLYVPDWNIDRQWEGHFTPLYRPLLASGFTPEELFLDDVHLTVTGHRLVARELAQRIFRLDLISREHARRSGFLDVPPT